MAKKKSILNEKSLRFLTEYLNNPSPTGFESPGQKIWKKYLEPYVDTFMTDPYGSLVGVINPEAPYKVVIEAHADEISWFVNYITNDGFIYLKRNHTSESSLNLASETESNRGCLVSENSNR